MLYYQSKISDKNSFNTFQKTYDYTVKIKVS